LPIIQERLASVLPAADLLVGTFSSTVAWAVGLGIPALVVDAIGSNFQLYRNVEGVVVVDSHADLQRELVRFVRQPERRRTLAQATAAGAARLGALDGRASERVVAAVAQAVAARSISRPATAFGQPHGNPAT
jgi:hypothetical protein